MNILTWCNICSVVLAEYEYYDSGYEVIGSMLITLVCGIISLLLAGVIFLCLWRIFKRAGKPGWASIVPVYNYYCLTEISLGNGWLFLLLFIPVANLVLYIMIYYNLAKKFGRGTGFCIGTVLFPFIFLIVLAFSDYQYIGQR